LKLVNGDDNNLKLQNLSEPKAKLKRIYVTFYLSHKAEKYINQY